MKSACSADDLGVLKGSSSCNSSSSSSNMLRRALRWLGGGTLSSSSGSSASSPCSSTISHKGAIARVFPAGHALGKNVPYVRPLFVFGDDLVMCKDL